MDKEWVEFLPNRTGERVFKAEHHIQIRKLAPG